MNRIAILLYLGWFALPCHAESRKNRIHNDMSSLALAATQYKTEYGAFPSGKSIEIVFALAGNNPRKILFIDWPPRYLDANGRFLDQWGTLYLISFPDAETVEIRSAGPDKSFDTADDKHFRKGPHGIDHNVQ